MLLLYKLLTKHAKGYLNALLERRLRAGKEDTQRIDERRGIPSLDRPKGKLIHLHAASVGEAQSALVLIKAILRHDKTTNILVTTGTVTSAQRMDNDLPKGAFHQFIPIDHPEWVETFLEHWKPNLTLWMESELWPNMLGAIAARNIPMALLNARLSDSSYRNWRLFRASIKKLLGHFALFLTQTDKDTARFKALGANNVTTTDNIKYSALPLNVENSDLTKMIAATQGREICVYASTHDGEEDIAINIHQQLTSKHPNLLTIIIPRHPDRGEDVQTLSQSRKMNTTLRGSGKLLPDKNTAIYIANTMGELGLFYRLSNIVYIGRSLSNDGGGGHNPIEAAQLSCAVLHGLNTQNLKAIYDSLQESHASLCAKDEQNLATHIAELLQNPEYKQDMINKAQTFSNHKAHVIETVMTQLKPYLDGMEIPTK